MSEGKPEEVRSSEGVVPVVRIHQSFPLGGQGAVMIFETYVPQDITVPQVNRIVDKLEAVAGRQMLKGTVAVKKGQLEQAEIQARNMARDITNIEQHYQRKLDEELAAGRRKPSFMNAKELQDKRTVEQSMEVNNDTIARLKKEIAELMALIDGEEQIAAE